MSEDSANNIVEYVQPHLPEDVGYPGLVEKGMCPQPTYHALFDAIDRRRPLDVKPPVAKHVRAIQLDLEERFHQAFDPSFGDVDVAVQVFISSRMFRLLVTSAYNADWGLYHPRTRDVLEKLYFDDDYKPKSVMLARSEDVLPEKSRLTKQIETSDVADDTAASGKLELGIPDPGLLSDDDMTGILAYMFRVPIHELKLDELFSVYLDRTTSLARITYGQSYIIQVVSFLFRFLREDGVFEQPDSQTPVWVRKLKRRMTSSQAEQGFSEEEVQKRLFDRGSENRLEDNKSMDALFEDGEQGYNKPLHEAGEDEGHVGKDGKKRAYRRGSYAVAEPAIKSAISAEDLIEFFTDVSAKQVIADVARAKRSDKDWTQQELADAAQVSLRTVQQMETGTGNPTVGSIEKVFAALE